MEIFKTVTSICMKIRSAILRDATGKRKSTT